MRRFFCLILCISLMILPAEAAPRGGWVALTFDDGPSGRFTRRLLDGLKERNVRATFLLCGYRMEGYPELTERIFREGHEIGIHGYSHRSMEHLSRRDIAREIQDTQALLPPDCRVKFLRPPGGILTEPLRQVAQARDLGILLWSVDPKDWAVHNSEVVVERIVDKVEDGAVILLHDLSDSSVDGALEAISRLKKMGYRFVTVSELATRRNYRIRPGVEYKSFPQKEPVGGEKTGETG